MGRADEFASGANEPESNRCTDCGGPMPLNQARVAKVCTRCMRHSDGPYDD